MRRSFLLTEAAISTALIFILFIVISFFPFRFELIKPIRQGLNDFDIYDLYFSGKNKAKNTRDTNIVLVELAESREDIARQVEILKKYSPKVIGMDIAFRKPSPKTTEDLLLLNVADRYDSIIWASLFELDSTDYKLHLSNSFFDSSGLSEKSAFINLIGTEYSVNRTFSPFLKVNGGIYTGFPARIVELYDPEKFKKLKKRNNNEEIIYYSGNMESYTNFSLSEFYQAEIKGFLPGKIKNKIVLLGFFKKDGQPVLDDMHFTPLNERVSGRSYPDMYGVVIHANIISMILSEKYIKSKSNSFSVLLSIIITFLFSTFILYRYKVKRHPSHWFFILVQLVLIVILTYLFLLVFAKWRIQVPLTPIILSIVLSVETIGLYKSLAKWLNKKWGYPSIFAKK